MSKWNSSSQKLLVKLELMHRILLFKIESDDWMELKFMFKSFTSYYCVLLDDPQLCFNMFGLVFLYARLRKRCYFEKCFTKTDAVFIEEKRIKKPIDCLSDW